VRYARHHAGRLPAIVVVRELRTWELFHPREEEDANVLLHGHWQRLERASTISYYVVLVLSLAGAWWWRRRRGTLAVLVVPVALVTLVSAVSFGETRFREAAEPALVILASGGLAALGTALARRRRQGPPPGAGRAEAGT
jgi:hypothetical protein